MSTSDKPEKLQETAAAPEISPDELIADRPATWGWSPPQAEAWEGNGPPQQDEDRPSLAPATLAQQLAQQLGQAVSVRALDAGDVTAADVAAQIESVLMQLPFDIGALESELDRLADRPPIPTAVTDVAQIVNRLATAQTDLSRAASIVGFVSGVARTRRQLHKNARQLLAAYVNGKSRDVREGAAAGLLLQSDALLAAVEVLSARAQYAYDTLRSEVTTLQSILAALREEMKFYSNVGENPLPGAGGDVPLLYNKGGEPQQQQ